MPRVKLPFTNNQLAKIMGAGAVFVIGNALLMRWLMQKRLKNSPYYVQARDTIMGNRALVNLLGEPVGFGSVDLDDNSKNYSTTTEAKFVVPLKGSKSEGMLFISAIRNPDLDEDTLRESESSPSKLYSGWILNNLEVTLKDRPNQKVVLVRDKSEEL